MKAPPLRVRELRRRLARFAVALFACCLADGVRAEQTEFVGRDACVPCHTRQAVQYRGSHHDRAMQLSDAKSVLGDFDDAIFTYHEITSTFFKKDGAYHVRTDGPDGKLHEYRIAYTFGVDPLQQYLIEFPGGRLQALNVCWDTRPKDEGGQRWFHLYPNENVTNRRDPQHVD